MTYPTPILPKDLDYDNVYEPAEDTFALLDCIEEDSINWSDTFSPLVCLEVGAGTGLGLTFLGSLLRHRHHTKVQRAPTGNFSAGPLLLATDLNPYAGYSAQATGLENKLLVDVVLCDLASSLLTRLHGGIDILLFNPPYVPTPSSEIYRGLPADSTTTGATPPITASWAGGVDGREVIDRFLPLLPSLLTRPHGIAYLVTVAENHPQEIVEWARQYQLRVEIPLIRRAGRERLHLLKFSHLP